MKHLVYHELILNINNVTLNLLHSLSSNMQTHLCIKHISMYLPITCFKSTATLIKETTK